MAARKSEFKFKINALIQAIDQKNEGQALEFLEKCRPTQLANYRHHDGRGSTIAKEILAFKMLQFY